MAFQYVLPHAVTSQLDSLRGRIRRIAFLRGCGLFLTLSCGLLIGTMLIDFLLDLETPSRLAGFVGFCVAEVLLFGFLLIRPLVVRLKDAEVASLAEEKFPELGERVSSLVELADPEIPEGEKGSPLMRDLLEEETLKELGRCDFDEAVSAKPAVRRLSYGLGTLLFLVLSLLIFPSVSSLLLARLFNPWGNYESVSRLLFEIEGAEEFVARGSDIEIVAKMAWRNGSDEPIPEPVQLSWRSEDGNSDVRTLSFDPDLDAFTTVIPDAQDSLEFFVSSEGSRSRRYQINVLDRPEVLTAKLEITPPGYLGRPRETLDGVTGEVSVFEHSRLTFDLTFSHPVEEASINWLSAMVLPESELAGAQQVIPPKDEDAPDLRVPGTTPNTLATVENLPATQITVAADGLSAKLEIPATIQGAFAFLLKESHGLENDDEPYRQLIITRDQPPILEVPGGEQDRARPSDVYGIRVSAVDDVALEELELHVSSREGLNRVIKAPTELLGQDSLEHEFRIDLSDIAVESGDFLKLQIRAADGRPKPFPNEVWSEVRYVAINEDASAQGTSDVLARQEQIRNELQDIRDKLREAVEQSDRLKDEAQRSLDNERKFAQQDDVTTLAEREAELAGRIAELSEEFSQHPLFANLSDELWNMAAEELDPAAIQLAGSTTQEPKDQIATIDKNSAVADMVEEGLADVAAEFEKLAELEEDLLELNRIAQRANQLADDAEQLEELRNEVAATEIQDSEPLEENVAQDRLEARQELAENQQLLMEEQTELMAALDNLMQQRPELLEAARDHQLEKLAELARQASEIAEPQERLAASLQKDAEQTRQAAAPLAERQQEITQQIEELAAQVNSKQSRQPVTPIDPELARQIADELLEGNLDQAEELSKQAQNDLVELAKELAENAQLPFDPKEAAAELAKRQNALAEELAAAGTRSDPGAEPAPDGDTEGSTENPDVGEFAAMQAALQMAAAQLQADRESRDEQQAAVNEAAETLQKLIEAAEQEPQDQGEALAQAAEQGREASDALEQLAENILPEAQQREEALEELQRLRKEDGTDEEELSDEELAARLQQLLDPPQAEPQQVAQEARQLAAAQQELREETETLDDEFVPESESTDNNQPSPSDDNAGDDVAREEQARSDAAQPLAEQQAALAEHAAALPAELGALERAEALAQLEKAQQALEEGQLQAAAEAQQEAQAALENFAREAEALAQAATPGDSSAVAPGEQVASDATSGPEPAGGQPAGGQPVGDQPSNVGQPGEQLASQAEQLADLQQQLQEAIAELGQQSAGDAPPGEQVAGEPSSQQSALSNEASEDSQAGSSEPGNSEATTSAPGTQQADAAAGSQSQGAEAGASAPVQALDELLAQQEELTALAAQLALQSAQQAGAESPATQSAAQTAQQSAQAESAARGGQFAQAADEASDAQQAAAATAEALQESAPALADQAQQLAQQQQQMAEAFEQLENSPAQRSAAQQAQQQQLAKQADQIAQALDELAGQLGAEPLDLQQQGQQASSAQQSAQQGQQSASQAAQNMQAGNQGQAAQQAQAAASALRQSADQAAANATPTNSDSPVPGEFAAQIADAMRQLQAAQEQLAQAAANSPQAGQPSGQSPVEAGPTEGSSEPGAAVLDASNGETAQSQLPSGDDSANGETTPGQPSQGDSSAQPGGTPASDSDASAGESGQQSGPTTSASSSSDGQPSSSSNGQSGESTQQRNGALTEAADALQQAAQMLSDAAQQLAADGSQSGDNQGQSNQQPSSQQPGLGNSGTGAFAAGEIEGPLDTELKRRAMKNWGKLTGNLKTEILQSSQRKANGDYAKLIKLYFEELAKAGQSEDK